MLAAIMATVIMCHVLNPAYTSTMWFNITELHLQLQKLKYATSFALIFKVLFYTFIILIPVLS